MAYCALSDVQALNPKRTYDDNSEPTSTQVGTLITQTAVEIDAVLQAQGYTVPITTPTNFVNFLKMVNAYGAASLAEMGMFPEISEKGSTPHWKVLWDTYKGWLKALRDGETPFDVATLGGDASSFYHEMEDQDDFPDPAFRKRYEDKVF